MTDDRFIVGVGTDDHEYTVNGVRYIVSSRFKPFNSKCIKDTFTETIEKYIKSDFAEWTNNQNGGIMNTECVSTAGKED